MANRVHIEVSEQNGSPAQADGSSGVIDVRQPMVHRGPNRGSRFWTWLLVMLCIIAGVSAAEGFRIVMPTLGSKLYRTFGILYYIPVVRKLDTALIFAATLVISVACVWDRLLRRLLKIDPVPGGAKWYRNPEAVGMLALGIGLLVVDASLVCLGVSSLSWGEAGVSSEAVLMTAAYVLLMMCVSWMRVDAHRRMMTLVSAVAVCLWGQQCVAQDERFQERESEYVATFILDTTDSFAKSADDAWKCLERNLNQLWRDRAGSNEDLVILARISGDLDSPLWIGSPLELRRQFRSPKELKSFVQKNVGDTTRSRVYEAMIVAMRRMMRNPNVKNGSAQSVLIVLSDLEQVAGSAVSAADVARVIGEYKEMNGAIGLFFVAEEHERWKHWDEKLDEIGIPHTVTSKREMSPRVMSFE